MSRIPSDSLYIVLGIVFSRLVVVHGLWLGMCMLKFISFALSVTMCLLILMPNSSFTLLICMTEAQHEHSNKRQLFTLITSSPGGLNFPHLSAPILLHHPSPNRPSSGKPPQ